MLFVPNNGDATFGTPSRIAGTTGVQGIDTGQGGFSSGGTHPLTLDGDGRPDLFTVDGYSGTTYALLGDGAGHFARPTLCVNPPADSRVVSEEIFGPLATVRGYADLDEVLDATRADQLGLGGYVIGEPARAATVARALDVGIVGVLIVSAQGVPKAPAGTEYVPKATVGARRPGSECFTVRRGPVRTRAAPGVLRRLGQPPRAR